MAPFRHLGMQMCPRQLTEVDTEHQNGEKLDFIFMFTLTGHVSWCQTGWFELEIADLLGFSHTVIFRVYRKQCDGEVVMMKMPR